MVCLTAVTWSSVTLIGKAVGIVVFLGAAVAALRSHEVSRSGTEPALMVVGGRDYYDFGFVGYLSVWHSAAWRPSPGAFFPLSANGAVKIHSWLYRDGDCRHVPQSRAIRFRTRSRPSAGTR